MKRALLVLAAAAVSAAQNRIILAIGAHCGDAEITTGAVLAKHAKLGDRIVILHLTLGEGGNARSFRPKLTASRKGARRSRPRKCLARRRFSRHIGTASCPTTTLRGAG
jgi:LmbE family N-acetylglucosaminyl deacetylase